MTGGLNNHGHHGRIRESSSGALVGKNIAGVGQIGKSSSNLLKEDRLAKANILNNENKKFITHAYDDKNKRNEANSDNSQPIRNLQIQRITSQQDR